jgi:hypothetical protein
MRQIFTSQRLETVEGVARMLEDAGIDIYVSQPRSYRGRRRGQFSYSEPVPANQQPAVWVRKAEDQPRARELLRAAGLLATTRPSYSGVPAAAETPAAADAGSGRWAWRVRIGLLLVIAAVAMFIWMGRHPGPPAPQAAPAAAPAAPQPPAQETPEDEDEEIRVRISPPPPDG